MSLRKHNNTSILLIGEPTETIETIFSEKRSTLALKQTSYFETGIRVLEEEDVDLVLLQLDLPDISGYKTLKRYLNNFEHIPVIVLLETENEIIENQAIKAGAQDVLFLNKLNKNTLKRAILFSLERFAFQRSIIQQNQIFTKRERSYNLSQKIATFGNWKLNLINNQMEWSDGIYNIFGLSKNQLTPTLSTFLSAVFNEEREKVETFFEQSTKDNQLHKLEFRILVHNSKVKHVVLSSTLDLDDATGTINLIGGLLDITDQKTTRQSDSKGNAIAIKKFKKKAIEDFYFQIKTPLSSISNLLFLAEKTNLSVEQREYLAGLKSSVNELSGTLYNILNYSVLSADAIPIRENEFDLLRFMENVKVLVHPKTIASSTNLIINLGKNLPGKIIADDIKLTQILYNILSISLEYAYSKDIIEINVEVVGDENKSLDFRIDNNGREWTKREQTKLPNDKNDAEVSLSITEKILNIVGGSLDIPSSRVFGTSFLVNIPIKTITAKNNKSIGLPNFDIRILLVEDHFLNQIATRKVLTVWSSHIIVDIAKNGVEGIAKFKTGNYDLILMDLQMPVMNGIDATRIIRKSSRIPIIALTAESSKKEREKCATIGMNDYITKPFKPQELYNAIQKQLARASAQNT